MEETTAPVEGQAPAAPEGGQIVERVIEKIREPESNYERIERERDEQKAELSKVWDKNNTEDDKEKDERPRDAKGQFTAKENTKLPEGEAESQPAKEPSKEAEPAAKDAKSEPAEEKPVEAKEDKDDATQLDEGEPKHAIEPPGHWDKSLKEAFAKLDADTAKSIAEAGLKDRQTLTKLGQQLKEAEPTLERLKAHEAAFKQAGLTTADAIDDLMRVHQALNTNPTQALRHLASKFGVDLWNLADGAGQEASTTSPDTAALTARINQLEAQIQQSATQAQEQTAAQIQSTIDAFKTDKPHFDKLETLIAEEVTVLRSSDPTLSTRELLAQAYERATLIHPEVRAEREAAKLQALEKERLDKAAKQAELAKKAAPLNVKSSPDDGAHDRPLRDDLRAIWNKNHR